MFKNGWMPPHPAFFLKRECYEKFGYYNTMFKYSGDYELMLRLMHKYNISTFYLPKIIVKMKMGGLGNQNFKAKIKANLEDRLAWKINDLNAGLFSLLKKPLYKLKQYYQRP
jgi:glycosyltransferase